MAFSDPFGGLPPELSGEARKLKMRESIMQALLQGSMKPPEAPQVKGRFQGTASPLAALSGPLGMLAAMKGMEGVEKGYSELGEKYRAGLTDALTQYRDTKTGRPESTIEWNQPTRPDGTGEPTEFIPGVKGDPRKAIMDAMISNYPQLRQLATLDYNAMEKANQPFSLAAGGKRFDAQGNVIAENENVTSDGIPMTVKEWKYYLTLSPENRKAFLDLKRAPGFLDLGGSYIPRPTNFPTDQPGAVVPLPATPGQTPAPVALPAAPGAVPQPVPLPNTGGAIPKTIPPEQTAEHKGEVAAAQQTGEAQAKRDFNMMGLSDILNEAKNILGGKTKPTSSLVGSLVDKAASVVGVAPGGSEQADQLRAIGGALTAKMPRMEGPQSNLDVQQYREMAGQVGDDTLPISRRLAALETIEKLWRKYDKSVPTAPGGASEPVVVDW